MEEHLRPSKDSTAQQRYDSAVKLLIRECARKNTRARDRIQPVQRTGSFFLFIQTKEMANFYKYFGHRSIIFMDSGFRVNRNAFPITFISVLDNFMKGRMVGVLISQFTDEHTYAKCLSELKRGSLSSVMPQSSMTDFDVSEISAFKKTWPELVVLICTFHSITGQNKWIDKHAPKALRQTLKDKFKELHFVKNDKVLRKKLARLKGFCTKKGLVSVKRYLPQS